VPRKAAKRTGGRSARAAPRPPLRTIYLVSDSTGNLPRHMLAAFLTQFPPGTFGVRARSFIDTPHKLDRVLADLGDAPGIVMHALVDRAMKRTAAERAAKLGLPACDLTGAFVEFLAAASGVSPSPSVRVLHDVNAAYRRRVKAVEFALEHDDGLGLDTLAGADVVLVGVSLTSESPTCMYLAQQGYQAGNVSLAIGIDPPAQLMALPKTKVAALVIDPRQLAEIRSRRQAAWHMTDTAYNRAASVGAEVTWSRRLFARGGWAMFDVTNQAIEETAARIVDRLGLGPPA
jgi:[pyruvate, water dikinase]-phosphate phosphotransferase / [pyruvate, water dikinase] kinase